MQRKDKWHLHTLKLLGSMSFSVLLGLNVVLFRGKRQGMERPVDGHSRGKWKGGGRGRAWLLSRGENWKHSYSICYFCYTEAVLVFEISLIFFFLHWCHNKLAFISFNIKWTVIHTILSIYIHWIIFNTPVYGQLWEPLNYVSCLWSVTSSHYH